MDVLIVERDVMMAEVLADALADEGLNAVAVADERDAAAIPPDDAPSIVITSMNRRGEDMKGMEVARRLCERWRCRGIILSGSPVAKQPRPKGPRESGAISGETSIDNANDIGRSGIAGLSWRQPTPTRVGALCQVITLRLAKASPRADSGLDGSVRFGAIVTNIETSLRASRSPGQILTASGFDISMELLIPPSLARAMTEPTSSPRRAR